MISKKCGKDFCSWIASIYLVKTPGKYTSTCFSCHATHGEMYIKVCIKAGLTLSALPFSRHSISRYCVPTHTVRTVLAEIFHYPHVLSDHLPPLPPKVLKMLMHHASFDMTCLYPFIKEAVFCTYLLVLKCFYVVNIPLLNAFHATDGNMK